MLKGEGRVFNERHNVRGLFRVIVGASGSLKEVDGVGLSSLKGWCFINHPLYGPVDCR